MRIIDLCAGSGMLAHSAAYTLADPTPNILSVDIDPAALAVCAAHGHTTQQRDLADITDGEAADWDADVICGGTPCQSVSIADTRKGVDGPSGLVHEWLRLVSASNAPMAVWENVHGAIHPTADWPDGLVSYVRGTLVRSGYRVCWVTLRANQVGLMHRRGRVFLVAVRQGPPVPMHVEQVLLAPNPGRGAMTPQAFDATRAQILSRRVGVSRCLPEQIGKAGGPMSWKIARAGAIRVHEDIVRRRIPHILTPGTTKVSPDLYEWLMGWPQGWAAVDGLSDADRIRLAGNGVCPRQAAAGITDCLDKLDWQNRPRLEPPWDGIVRP